MWVHIGGRLELLEELGELHPELLGDFSKKWSDKLDELRERKEQLYKKEEVAFEGVSAEKIEYWQKSVSLIYLDKSEQWEKYLYDRQVAPEKIDTTISIMERLEEGASFEEVFEAETKNLVERKEDSTKREASQKLYNEIWGVMLFSKRGVEFFEYYTSQLYLQFGIDESSLLVDEKKRLEKIREINERNERKNIESGKVSPEEIERRKADKKVAKESVKKMNTEIDGFGEF